MGMPVHVRRPHKSTCSSVYKQNALHQPTHSSTFAGAYVLVGHNCGLCLLTRLYAYPCTCLWPHINFWPYGAIGAYCIHAYFDTPVLTHAHAYVHSPARTLGRCTCLSARTSKDKSSLFVQLCPGHNYIGHNYIEHNCVVHNCIGHTYTGHSCMYRP